MRKLFIMVALMLYMHATAQINRIEYYFNSDPGHGQATPVTITPAVDITNQAFTLNTTSLPDGINYLYVRSCNADGVWSQTASQLFYKLSTTTAPAATNLTALEYYFNTDPGHGQATPVTITPGVDIANQAFTPNTTALPDGINYLYVRSRNANGVWSQTASQLFYKLSTLTAPAPTNLTGIEYYFNTDPGHGQATPVTITPGVDIAGQVFTPNTTSLPDGINYLYVRSRNANGVWSQTASQLFYKLSIFTASAATNLTAIEYYFNTDPGHGQATAVTITPGVDIAGQTFTPNTTALPEGINYLYVRSRNSDGVWSQTASQLFYKLSAASHPAVTTINRMEYFIGADPGYGQAIPVVFNPADSLVGFTFAANVAGLDVGNHLLQIRSRNAAGQWSLNAIDTITIATPRPAQAIVVNSILTNATSIPGIPYLEGSSQAQRLDVAAICAGTKIAMAFDPSGSFDSANIFTVQLSDEVGSFASPVIIGQTTGTTGQAVLNGLPRHITPGDNYKIRVVSSNPVVTGDANLDAITINDINLGPDTTLFHACPGETTNLLTLYNTTGLTASWTAPNPSVVMPGIYTLIANNAINCPDTAVATVKLETATWVGIVSSDWHNPTNWNINKVPSAKTHVIIPGVTANPCIISTANAQAASIQVLNGATLQAVNNRVAEINGKCSVLPPG
ncbi:MAG: hypothetical protein ABIX01_02985 [Chitinophagaceae bacterium]